MRMTLSRAQVPAATLVVALLTASVALAQSEPGKRPDLKPSPLEFWTSLESRTLAEIRKVREIDEELESTRQDRQKWQKTFEQADSSMWNPWDEQDRARRQLEHLDERIKELEEERELAGSTLQDLLASTPGERTAPEMDVTDYTLNKEAIEIRNALENLSAMARRLVEEIKSNPKDTKKAVEAYDAQLRMLGYVQLMHAEFLRRCQEEYPKYLDDLDRATHKFVQKQNRVVRDFDGPDQDREILLRNIEKAESLQERIPALRANLRDMQAWARQNLEKVRQKKVVLDSLRDTAVLVNQAKEIAGAINTAFGELSFEEPPLVEFEFDPESIEIEFGGTP